jgi:hypothetical protein
MTMPSSPSDPSTCDVLSAYLDRELANCEVAL